MKRETVKLKDGREVMLRTLSPDDKDQLMNMVTSLSKDALRWSNPPYDEARVDRWMGGAETGLSIVAAFEDRIVGIAAIYQFTRPREEGIGGMMVYIHQDFHGVGMGFAMTEKILSEARRRELHRVGLEVVEDNVPAVQLYKKAGFEIEGTLKDGYFGEDGEYYNILVMGLLLSKK